MSVMLSSEQMKPWMRLYRAEINPPPLSFSRVLLVLTSSVPSVLSETCSTAPRRQYFVQIGSPHRLWTMYKCHYLGRDNHTFLYCWNMRMKCVFFSVRERKKCKQGFLCARERHKRLRIIWNNNRCGMVVENVCTKERICSKMLSLLHKAPECRCLKLVLWMERLTKLQGGVECTIVVINSSPCKM